MLVVKTIQYNTIQYNTIKFIDMKHITMLFANTNKQSEW